MNKIKKLYHKIFNKPVQKEIVNTKPEKVHLRYLETHLCDHCNLNCKGCGHFCSLLDTPHFYDIEQFKLDIKKLSSKIDFAKIRLMGGEPLLHPEVNEFIIATREAFPKCDLRLVTNGILLPKMKENFWDCLRNNNVAIDLSKYPIVNDKISQYLDIIDDNNVHLGEIRLAKRFRAWHTLHPNNDQKISYRNCTAKYCINLWKSKLYPCPACYRYYMNEYFKTNLGIPEGLDIYSMTTEDIVKTFYHDFDACKYCDITNQNIFLWDKSNRSLDEWLAYTDEKQNNTY